eukprot:jgi/Chlat1/6286/Chrsp44S05876
MEPISNSLPQTVSTGGYIDTDVHALVVGPSSASSSVNEKRTAFLQDSGRVENVYPAERPGRCAPMRATPPSDINGSPFNEGELLPGNLGAGISCCLCVTCARSALGLGRLASAGRLRTASSDSEARIRRSLTPRARPPGLLLLLAAARASSPGWPTTRRAIYTVPSARPAVARPTSATSKSMQMEEPSLWTAMTGRRMLITFFLPVALYAASHFRRHELGDIAADELTIAITAHKLYASVCLRDHSEHATPRNSCMRLAKRSFKGTLSPSGKSRMSTAYIPSSSVEALPSISIDDSEALLMSPSNVVIESTRLTSRRRGSAKVMRPENKRALVISSLISLTSRAIAKVLPSRWRPMTVRPTVPITRLLPFPVAANLLKYIE